MGEQEQWQLDGPAPELYQRYLRNRSDRPVTTADFQLGRCRPGPFASQNGELAPGELAQRIGSGAGIRTLNLAVNRSLRPVQKWRPDFTECR